MDINSLFRRFFHINPGYPSDPFSHYTDEKPENDDMMFHDDFKSFDHHIDMFKQMEGMFSKMFSSSFGIKIGFPSLEENLPPQTTNPRKTMIKEPDEEEISDSSSYKRNFGPSMLPFFEDSGKEDLVKPHLFSYSKFSSISVHLPDGTVEEHQTVVDDNGSKITTVRRTIGDTSHEITIKSDQQGIKEKEENFLNMDESELSSFEQKWKKIRNGDSVKPEVPSINLPASNPSYLNILQKYLGSSSNDEMKWI